jgi:hypothetical protein
MWSLALDLQLPITRKQRIDVSIIELCRSSIFGGMVVATSISIFGVPAATEKLALVLILGEGVCQYLNENPADPYSAGARSWLLHNPESIVDGFCTP